MLPMPPIPLGPVIPGPGAMPPWGGMLWQAVSSPPWQAVTVRPAHNITRRDNLGSVMLYP
ncbi:hypothetical protein AA0313_0740 [Acetobacter indonesiensis NRIC 0313]|nr:hypothetical protein AA0313_0740 [Acetobacter indonesiensis NRIC 0313]